LGENLIRDVAESFRNLDSIRAELQTLRDIHVDVGRFLQDYQGYLQIVARRRGEQVRSQHSRYEETNRGIGEQNRLKGAAEAEIKAADEQKHVAGLRKRAADSELQALHESPHQRDAISLDAARQQAEWWTRELKRREDERASRVEQLADAEAEHAGQDTH